MFWKAAAPRWTQWKPPSSCMEDDETFDAGRGSFLTRDGRVQLDALMMDGATLRAGGVGCVERISQSDSRFAPGSGEEPACLFCGRKARSVLPKTRHAAVPQ